MGAAAGDRSLKLLIQTQLPSTPREERVVRREEVRVGDLALRREQLRLADRRPELLVRRVVEGQQLVQRRLFDDPAALGRVDPGILGLRALLEPPQRPVLVLADLGLAGAPQHVLDGVEIIVVAAEGVFRERVRV